MVMVFEGVDAAGKGGSHPPHHPGPRRAPYHIIPIAAPTEEERAQPYLWRFWRNLPRRGRSPSSTAAGTAGCWWSGWRASAPRPTGCAPTARSTTSRSSSRAAAASSLKFWLAISQDEQLRRFKERAGDAVQALQDHRRGLAQPRQMGRLRGAICDMLDRTSTEIAPWTLVESEDKYFGRIKILQHAVRADRGAALARTIDRPETVRSVVPGQAAGGPRPDPGVRRIRPKAWKHRAGGPSREWVGTRKGNLASSASSVLLCSLCASILSLPTPTRRDGRNRPEAMAGQSVPTRIRYKGRFFHNLIHISSIIKIL